MWVKYFSTVHSSKKINLNYRPSFLSKMYLNNSANFLLKSTNYVNEKFIKNTVIFNLKCILLLQSFIKGDSIIKKQ